MDNLDLLDLGTDLPDLAEISETDEFSLNVTICDVPKPVFSTATRKNPLPFKNQNPDSATSELIDSETSAIKFLSLCAVSNTFRTQSYRLMRYIAMRCANLTSMGQQSNLSNTRDDPDTDVERNLITYMCQLQSPKNLYWAEIG